MYSLMHSLIYSDIGIELIDTGPNIKPLIEP